MPREAVHTFVAMTQYGPTIFPGRDMAEYDHYAEHMNALITANGGSISEEDHDRFTVIYNKRFGKNIPMLNELTVSA